MSSLPDSIFERSSTSPMSASRAEPADLIVSANSRCSVDNGLSTNRSVMPRMLAIGVRICRPRLSDWIEDAREGGRGRTSWESEPMNADLSLSASSAASASPLS